MQRQNFVNSFILYIQNYFAKIKWGYRKMSKINGKTQETNRRRENCERKDESPRLGEHGCNSKINGDDQIRYAATHSPEENYVRSICKQGESTAGKILERLEFIENAYVSYVDAHLQRLEERLTEGKERKKIFDQEIRQLKQEIYNLVSEESEE